MSIPIDRVALSAAALLVIALVAVARAIRAVRASHRRTVVQRLRCQRGGSAAAEPMPAVGHALVETLRPIARMAAPAGEEEISRIRLQLSRGGLRRDSALPIYLATKVALALAAVVAVLALDAMRLEPLHGGLALAVGASAFAFYAPNLWLSRRIAARQLAIRRGLPDSLDLLVTCVEAGLALDASLVRVAAETRAAFPVLADELELTFLEVKAGMTRPEAFRRLADRTGVDDLKQLAATLTQTEAFGTSVGVALRVQADGMRVRRMQRAEEQAAMVGVKMTLPLVFCILPSLFCVVLGPAIVNVTEKLFPNLR